MALALIGETFPGRHCEKRRAWNSIGPGVANLSMEYRNGIDVMTTETACLSSVWQTDETVHQALAALWPRRRIHAAHAPADGAYYDKLIELDLSRVEPMIALPFHPSNAYTIAEFKANMADLLHQHRRTRWWTSCR